MALTANVLEIAFYCVRGGTHKRHLLTRSLMLHMQLLLQLQFEFTELLFPRNFGHLNVTIWSE